MRILLVTGKGGGGTTTIAAASATVLADAGHRTVLLSSDGDVAAGLAGTSVRVIVPAGQATLERWWPTVSPWLDLPLQRLGSALPAVDALAVPAGSGVLALLAVLVDTAGQDDADVLVVDAGPTSSAIALLSVPDAARRALGALIPLQHRLIGGVRGAVAFAAFQSARARLRSVGEILTDPTSVSARLVMVPEAAALTAARRARAVLALHGVGVDGLVVNRVPPPGGDGLIGTLARQSTDVQADAAHRFADIAIHRIDLRAGGTETPAALRAIGGQAGAADESPVPRTSLPPPSVSATDDGYVYEIQLPGAVRDEVAVSRVGEELLLSVAGYRRALALPSGLRRCTVTGAGCTDGVLRVRFAPDPQLWPA